MDFETRLDNVAQRAWQIWTDSGYGLDDDGKYQTMRHAIDVANNSYLEKPDETWIADTLAALKGGKP